MRCIKSEYVLPGAANRIWTDASSGADRDTGVWRVDAKDHKGLSVSTFISRGNHYDSGGEARYRVRLFNEAPGGYTGERGWLVAGATGCALVASVIGECVLNPGPMDQNTFNPDYGGPDWIFGINKIRSAFHAGSYSRQGLLCVPGKNFFRQPYETEKFLDYKAVLNSRWNK